MDINLLQLLSGVAVALAGGSVATMVRKTLTLLIAERKVRKAILPHSSAYLLESNIEVNPELQQKILEKLIQSLSEANKISKSEKDAILEPLNQHSEEGRKHYIERLLWPITHSSSEQHEG